MIAEGGKRGNSNPREPEKKTKAEVFAPDFGVSDQKRAVSRGKRWGSGITPCH